MPEQAADARPADGSESKQGALHAARVGNPPPSTQPGSDITLDQPAQLVSSPFPTVTSVDPGQGPMRLLVIRYFGDYEIEKEIGRGGMGVIYKARQVSLNRPVALKMIKAGVLAGEADLRRFQNEAETVARLDHGGIVPVYEVGEHEGQQYFSMKLVEGGNLADQLLSFKDRFKATAEFLAATAEAVHHAHMCGVLHRDLKPANILIDPDENPLVTDFGLAKLVEGDEDMTASGAVLGTPAYMSPEQAAGRRGTITTATDVYGLGAILYAMLTGKAPFGGDAVVDTLTKVKQQAPERPSKINVRVPRDLETICLKCLEKDPRRRYASAHELAVDIDNWRCSRPILARRVGVAERAWLWYKRKPAVASLAAAVAMALIAGTAGILTIQAKANFHLRKANGMLDAAIGNLRESNIALDAQRTRAEQRETLAIEAVKKFGDAVTNNLELKNNPALKSLRKTLLKEPLDFFKSLRDRIQTDHETRPESLIRLADASFALGGLTAQIGDQQDAIVAYQESLAVRQQLADANPNNPSLKTALARLYNNIGNGLINIGQTTEASHAFESALAILRALAAANPNVAEYQADLSTSYSNFAVFLGMTGRTAEALEACTAAKTILEKLSDVAPAVEEYRNSLSSCHHNIAVLLSMSGKRQEALKSEKSALVLLQRLSDAHPTNTEFLNRLAGSHNSTGVFMSELGNPGGAIIAYESATAIQQKLVEANPTVNEFQESLADTQNNLALLLSGTGKPVEAMTVLKASLATRKGLADANPSVVQYRKNLGGGHNNLGQLYKQSGHAEEAQKAYEAALAIRQKLAEENPESPDHASSVGGSWNNLAVIDLEANRLERGCERLRLAIAWQRKAMIFDPNNSAYRQTLVMNLQNLAHAAAELGDVAGSAEAQRELAQLIGSDPASLNLDARVTAFLKGEAPDNAERLAAARQSYDAGRYAAATQLWADALQADPKLAGDRRAQHRYNAACAAALAASGKGIDDPPPHATAKAALRHRAHELLKAELATWRNLLGTATPAQREAIAETLKHWKQDPDLAGIRDDAELATQPENEREEWQTLWADVDGILAKASRVD